MFRCRVASVVCLGVCVTVRRDSLVSNPLRSHEGQTGFLSLPDPLRTGPWQLLGSVCVCVCVRERNLVCVPSSSASGRSLEQERERE